MGLTWELTAFWTPPRPPSTNNDRRQEFEVFRQVLFLRQIYTSANRWETSQDPSWQRGNFFVTLGQRHVSSSLTEWCAPVNNPVDFIIPATLALAWIKHSPKSAARDFPKMFCLKPAEISSFSASPHDLNSSSYSSLNDTSLCHYDHKNEDLQLCIECPIYAKHCVKCK